MPRALWENKHLFLLLVKKEIKDQYAGACFGVGWAFLHPLALMALYGFVFSVVLKTTTGQAFSNVPFAYWLLTGLLPWTFFSEALSRSVRSITGNGALVTKSKIDKRVLPLSSVLSAVVGHCVFLSLLLVISPFFAVLPAWQWIVVLVFVPCLILFAGGCALLLAACNVYSKDTEQFLSIVLQFGFFLTPIAYSAEMAPKWAQTLLCFNPMYHFVSAYRTVIIAHELPSIAVMAAMISGCMIFFLAAQAVFQKLSPDFADFM